MFPYMGPDSFQGGAGGGSAISGGGAVTFVNRQIFSKIKKLKKKLLKNKINKFCVFLKKKFFKSSIFFSIFFRSS
jgi:hypothetical protein